LDLKLNFDRFRCEELREESPQQEVAALISRGGYPAGDGLYSAPALAVPRVSKQQIIEPLENAGQARVGLDIGFSVHAFAPHEFVPVVVLAAVHVESATGCRWRGVNDELADPHHAIRVVVHFDDEHCGAHGGGGFGDVGRRPVNAARMVVPAAPICILTPRIIVKSRARHLVHLFAVCSLFVR